MPAIFAHYQFGMETAARFDVRARRIIGAHRLPFALGLQGPDFYFFDQLLQLRGKKYAAVGGRLHHGSCAALLAQLTGEGGRRPDSAALAYLIGLIGHFALDSTCHPAIDRWVQTLPYNHHRMETEFDRYLLTRSDVSDPRRFPLGSCIAASRSVRLQVGRLYERAGLGSAADLAQLIGDFARIKNLLQTPGDRRYHTYQRLLRLAGAQEAIGGIFMGPQDEMSELTNPQLLALFIDAQARYSQLVENFLDHIFEGVPLDAYFARDFETAPEEETR